MKLRQKIMLCFLLSFSVAFVVLLVVVRTKTGRLSASITQDLTQQLVQSKAEEIGSWLSQRISEMRIASEYADMRDIDSEAALEYLSSINNLVLDDFGSLRSTFALVDSSGFGWVDKQNCVDLLSQNYFIEAMSSQNEYHLSMPITSLIDGQRAIMISYPLTDEQNVRYGCMVGSISVSKLQEVLSEIRVFDGAVWLMDDNGQLIAEGLQHEEYAPRSPGQFSLKALAAILYHSGVSERILLADGSTGYLTYTTVPNTTGWLLCVLTSEEAMYGQASAVERSIVLVWICILVMLVLICIALAESLTRPLSALRSAMDSVEAGALDTYYPPQGRDEVAKLGKSFNAMLSRIRRLLKQISQEEQAKHAAEFRALQAQINPHFIYNTLDTLHWKAVSSGVHDIADITAALASFFRISLSQGREFISLNEEAEHAYHYLFIQQARYANRLSFDIALEPELNDISVPKLILQPLVENSLNHGIKPVSYNGNIAVNIKSCENRISIVVEDNGAGMSLDRLEMIRAQLIRGECAAGYGLYNITQRLHLIYGENYHIEIESEENKGTKVSLFLPYKPLTPDYSKEEEQL